MACSMLLYDHHGSVTRYCRSGTLGTVFPTITLEPLVGVQMSASLESKWTPGDLFRVVEARKHVRKSMSCWTLFWWT